MWHLNELSYFTHTQHLSPICYPEGLLQMLVISLFEVVNGELHRNQIEKLKFNLLHYCSSVVIWRGSIRDHLNQVSWK